MKKNKKLFLSILTVPVIFVITGFAFLQSDIYFEVAKNIDIFTRVYKEIAFNYVDDINPEQFLRAGIRGMLETLDPYTIFIDEKRKDDIDLLTSGKYGGIGVTIGIRDEKVTILEIMEGYSAQKQGIHIGDIILSVDSVSINRDNFEDISTYVKGEPGSFVKLKILRFDTDTLVYNLFREEIIIKNVTFCDFFPENSNNVYIKLTGFGRSAGDELKKAIFALKSKKEIKSVIFDLRGNPGGLLDAAVDITSKFIKKGDLVVFTKGRDTTNIKYYYSQQEPLLGDVPVTILINDGSASASEIVAGAIQDHDRGLILGTKTFGKGLVQTITPLSFNTSLKITTSKYYTPSGRCIQKIDYSHKNLVFSKEESNSTSPFSTDNQRTVYGSGGITPDSVIDYEVQSEILIELLAKGTVFKFATNYYEKNKDIDFNKIQDEKLFSGFIEFLKKENFELKGKAYNFLQSFDLEVKNLNKYYSIKNEISLIKEELNKIYFYELSVQKEMILVELKNELANRYFAKDKAYLVKLSNDKLVASANEIFKLQTVYNLKLNKNK